MRSVGLPRASSVIALRDSKTHSPRQYRAGAYTIGGAICAATLIKRSLPDIYVPEKYFRESAIGRYQIDNGLSFALTKTANKLGWIGIGDSADGAKCRGRRV